MNLLLVEDERKLSTLLKQLLEDERYAVDIAADGERSQELAETALDLKTHQVRRGDTPIELTAREFALLEFLMRHPNQVLTQAQIAERVWDYNFEGTTNRVAVYISYLRDKIDEGRSPKLIQTVYGVGYRLSG